MHFDTNKASTFPYKFHGCLAMHADIKERHPVRFESLLGTRSLSYQFWSVNTVEKIRISL